MTEGPSFTRRRALSLLGVGAGLGDVLGGAVRGSAAARGACPGRPGPPTQDAKLFAADGGEFDRFGRSLALSGSTALVGAFGDAEPNGRRAGSAYVLERTDGSWRQRAKLAAGDGDAGDEFGGAVALSGSTALVGAAGPYDGREGPGAAYVFERAGEGWRQRAKLVAADGDGSDGLGDDVALSGSTALVGASTDEDPNGRQAGSAYVFERADGEWVETAKLVAPDGAAGDRFGVSVALGADGSTALVGAVGVGARDDYGNGRGAAYVFERTGAGWRLRETLRAADGEGGDGFGGQVALSGSTALVGADAHGPRESGGAPVARGAAYVFERSRDGWRQDATLVADDGDRGDAFGSSVSLQGSTALVTAGADLAYDPRRIVVGSVYAFRRVDGVWEQRARLVPTDADAYRACGAIALDGSTALVGAVGDDTLGDGAGAVYAYDLDAVAGPNEPPTAAFTVQPAEPTAGGTVVLDARASSDPEGTIERYVWREDDRLLTIDSPRILTAGFRSGERTVSLTVVDDDGRTATASRTVSVAEAGDGPSVRLRAPTLAPGGTGTLEVHPAWIDEPVAAYDLTIRTDAPEVAAIVDASPGGDPPLRYARTSVADDGSRATVRAERATAEIEIATLSLAGESPGSATFDLTVDRLEDASGTSYEDPTALGTPVLVAPPAEPTVDGFRAGDPDRDGLREDINGDGDAGVGDVVSLFERLEDDAVRCHPHAFDFTGDGRVGLGDVIRLFREL